MGMKTLTKLLTGTALATALTFNSYSQEIKNTIVAYVSIKGNEKETILNVDSLKSYNLSFAVEKTNLLDLMMAKKPKEKEIKYEDKTKLYIVRKTEKETQVIPTILEGEYDFSRDSKAKIEKQVRAFVKDEKISISDAVKYGSEEMFMELTDW